MALLVVTSFADSAFEFVTDNNGYSYIQINHDMDAFQFQLEGYSGNKLFDDVVYYTFDGNSPANGIGDKKPNGSHSVAKDGTVELKNLKAGDKIGFSMEAIGISKYHNQFNWNFQGLDEYSGRAFFSPYASGKKDKGLPTLLYTYPFHNNDYVTLNGFTVNGHYVLEFSNDWDTYKNLYNETKTAGTPLPGFLAMLVVGGAGIGLLKRKKK